MSFGAPARADAIGAFEFLPPFSAGLPTTGTVSLGTKCITLSGNGETERAWMVASITLQRALTDVVANEHEGPAINSSTPEKQERRRRLALSVASRSNAKKSFLFDQLPKSRVVH